MRALRALLLALAVAMLLAVPATAQDESEVVGAIDAAMADIEAELATLDASDRHSLITPVPLQRFRSSASV